MLNRSCSRAARLPRPAASRLCRRSTRSKLTSTPCCSNIRTSAQIAARSGRNNSDLQAHTQLIWLTATELWFWMQTLAPLSSPLHLAWSVAHRMPLYSASLLLVVVPKYCAVFKVGLCSSVCHARRTHPHPASLRDLSCPWKTTAPAARYRMRPSRFGSSCPSRRRPLSPPRRAPRRPGLWNNSSPCRIRSIQP